MLHSGEWCDNLERYDILILGSGVAGLTAALESAKNNRTVAVVDRNPLAGGLCASLGCKAADRCGQCGLCLYTDALSNARKDENIRFFLGCSANKLTRIRDGFTVELASLRRDAAQQRIPITSRSIIVATGAEPFNARLKPQFGYGQIPGVLTGHDLEKILQPGGPLVFPGRTDQPGRIAFIQCVGSRDKSVNHEYCSQVCCRYALRIGHVLKTRFPQASLTFFYMDIQISGKGFAEFFEKNKKDFEFVRAIPGKLSTGKNGQIVAIYDNCVTGKIEKAPFDLVVLSVGLSPPPTVGDTARLLGLNRTRNGFFEGLGADRTRTNARGIFIAGTCESPKDIAGAVAQARAAVGAALSER